MAKQNRNQPTRTVAPAPAQVPAEETVEQQAPEGTGEEEITEENTAPDQGLEQTSAEQDAEAPVADETITSTEAPKVIEDDVSKKTSVFVAPVAAAPEVASVVEEVAAVETSVTDPVDGDDENVLELKKRLGRFKNTVNGYGKTPEDFKAAAGHAAAVTKFVIQFPKAAILDTLLAFFVENKNGVCAPENFMKGSTTLVAVEEQQVGYLFNLFSDLANKRIVRVNSSSVINILKKPEILSYYDRKVNGLKAARG